jgi:hypothetical protein
MGKPVLFVGSSTTHLHVARSAGEKLNEVADVRVWDEGIFRLSSHTLESLLAILTNADFGLFVFAPDDVVRIGDAEQKTTRDNVIFELGLFMGRLGPERCFILEPDGIRDFRLPSDLAGLTTARYALTDQPDPHNDRLATACNQIRTEIGEQGPRVSSARPADVDDREHALAQILTSYEKNHLQNLVRGSTAGYHGRGSLRAELRHLRALELLRSRPDTTIGSMRSGMEFDLSHYVELTDLGRRVATRLQ